MEDKDILKHIDRMYIMIKDLSKQVQDCEYNIKKNCVDTKAIGDKCEEHTRKLNAIMPVVNEINTQIGDDYR